MNYHVVKRFGGDELYVEPDRAEKLKEAMSTDKDALADVNGVTLRLSTIMSIEPSSRPVESNLERIQAPESWQQEEALNPDGSVPAWHIKKEVSPKEWDTRYSKLGYELIDKDSQTVTIGFWRAAHHGVKPGEERI